MGITVSRGKKIMHLSFFDITKNYWIIMSTWPPRIYNLHCCGPRLGKCFWNNRLFIYFHKGWSIKFSFQQLLKHPDQAKSMMDRRMGGLLCKPILDQTFYNMTPIVWTSMCWCRINVECCIIFISEEQCIISGIR